MSNQQSTIHPHNTERCPHCQTLADLRQVLMAYTGIIRKESRDPVSLKAANQLYENAKRIKIQEELK